MRWRDDNEAGLLPLGLLAHVASVAPLPLDRRRS